MPGKATQLLRAWRKGDASAFGSLVELLYEELKQLAGGQMRGQAEGHTLQPTALVHEAYARLAGSGGTFEDRAHFLAAAATVMRRILIDHARSRMRLKRGGKRLRVTLSERRAGSSPGHDRVTDVIALDDALRRLAIESPRKSRAVELRFFGGLTLKELATILEVSVGTAHRDLRIATAWLHRELTA